MAVGHLVLLSRSPAGWSAAFLLRGEKNSVTDSRIALGEQMRVADVCAAEAVHVTDPNIGEPSPVTEQGSAE